MSKHGKGQSGLCGEGEGIDTVERERESDAAGTRMRLCTGMGFTAWPWIISVLGWIGYVNFFGLISGLGSLIAGGLFVRLG